MSQLIFSHFAISIPRRLMSRSSCPLCPFSLYIVYNIIGTNISPIQLYSSNSRQYSSDSSRGSHEIRDLVLKRLTHTLATVDNHERDQRGVRRGHTTIL